jgi:hypothetical protein
MIGGRRGSMLQLARFLRWARVANFDAGSLYINWATGVGHMEDHSGRRCSNMGPCGPRGPMWAHTAHEGPYGAMRGHMAPDSYSFCLIANQTYIYIYIEREREKCD